MTRKLILMVMSLAATAAVALGDVLRWDGGTDLNMMTVANWYNETTGAAAARAPQAGDTLVIENVSDTLNHNHPTDYFTKYAGIIGRGVKLRISGRGWSYASGGCGFVCEVTESANVWSQQELGGHEVEYNIKNAGVTAAFSGSWFRNGSILKTGLGTLSLPDKAPNGNDNTDLSGVTLCGGSVIYPAFTRLAGFVLKYDADNTSLVLGGTAVQDMTAKDVDLQETANVTASTHKLGSATAGAVLRFTGTPASEVTRFTGVIDGTLSLNWNPDSSDYVLEFAKGQSVTTGKLTVLSGKVVVDDGARFTSLASLEVADGAALEVGAGSVIVASSLVVNGAQMPSGYYKGVDWFEGDGIVFVPFPDPGPLVAATWVGGVDAKLSTDGNWQGGKAPNLTDGTAVVTVKPTAVLSSLKVPSGCYLNGLKFDLPSGNGTLSVSLETAGGRLLLGAAGLDASAAKASVDFALPIVTVVANSVLDCGPDGVFDFKDEFAAMGGTIAVKGRGHADLRKDAELGGAVLDLQSGSAYFVLHGVTVDAGLNVNTSDSDAGFLILAESGTTNYLKGCLSIVGYKAFTCNAKSAGGGGLLVLEGGCDGNANTGLYNVRVDKKPLKLVGRLYSPLTDDGDVYLNVASNQFGRNSYTMGDGVNIHALVPYAIWGGPRTIYSTSYLQTQVEVTGNKAASMDLGGFDQEITAIRVADSSTYDVTSEQPAQLHLDFQWPSTMYQSGTTTVYPDVYANNVTFSGNAGLTFEGKDEAPWNTFALKRDSLTQGKLEVKSGTMAMEAKWPNANVVEVSGGKLVLKQARAFGKSCVANLTGGQVELAASQDFASLTVDGVTLADGIYGGKDSPAAFKPKYADGTYVFTGKGVARIGDLGMALIVR